MKKLLTITALLFSVTSFGQTVDDTLKMFDWGVRGLNIKSKDDGFSKLQFGNNNHEIAKIKSSGNDTLEITYHALIQNKHLFKYIKVGDKIFQEIEPTIKWYSHPNGWYQQPYYPNIKTDTSFYPVPFKINNADTSHLIKKYKKQ